MLYIIRLQVILITDGSTRRSFNIDTLTKPGSPLPFSFPGKLVVVTVAQPGPPNPILHKLVEMAGGDGSVLQLDSPLTPHSLYNLFQKLAETNYSSFSGMLKCGNLGSKVILSPTPMVEYISLVVYIHYIILCVYVRVHFEQRFPL